MDFKPLQAFKWYHYHTLMIWGIISLFLTMLVLNQKKMNEGSVIHWANKRCRLPNFWWRTLISSLIREILRSLRFRNSSVDFKHWLLMKMSLNRLKTHLSLIMKVWRNLKPLLEDLGIHSIRGELKIQNAQRSRKFRGEVAQVPVEAVAAEERQLVEWQIGKL